MFEFKVPIPLRIALILGFMTSSVLWSAYGLRMLPDSRLERLQTRMDFGKAQTLTTLHFLESRRHRDLERYLDSMVRLDNEIVSIGVRQPSGRLLIDVNQHNENWDIAVENASDPDHFVADIVQGRRVVGRLEIRYSNLEKFGIFQPLLFYPGPMILSASTLVVFLSWLFLRNVLKALNPSKVVPMRVRSALDALSEALFLIDQKGRFVLVNQAFVNLHPGASDLIGKSPDQFRWYDPDGKNELEDLPWNVCLKESRPCQGVVVGFFNSEGQLLLFNVNAVPILGENQVIRGALVSMDDITAMEMRKAQLARMLEELQENQEVIKKKNIELEFLATRDPLTGCLNRRSFYETFEKDRQSQTLMSCAMVDIDHFKSINDNHGHAMGDAVLKEVGSILREKSPVGEKVCRFGGEEFCVFLPGVDADEVIEICEKIREVLANTQIGELRITASLGISTSYDPDVKPEDLLEEADQALYFSKHNGRNQVTHFARIPEDFDPDADNRVADSRITLESLSIPFESVSALMRALSYRDQRTASHSCRVANLCVATATSIMTPREVYILEAAALLHDIGKIGVPDAILLKPGRLSELEWQIMDEHDHYSVEIVQAAYGSQEVIDIVECHHSHFGKVNKNLPTGKEIPLGARILAICDAYDAMVTDRVYRKGRSREDAVNELRRCAPEQFDPDLVELFIEATEDLQHEFDEVISTQCALQVGMHVEKLSEAVTRTDLPSIRQITRLLIEKTETEPAVSAVTDAARKLETIVDGEERELQHIFAQTNELLNACRVARAGLVNFNYCRLIDHRENFLRKQLGTLEQLEELSNE